MLCNINYFGKSQIMFDSGRFWSILFDLTPRVDQEGTISIENNQSKANKSDHNRKRDRS